MKFFRRAKRSKAQQTQRSGGKIKKGMRNIPLYAGVMGGWGSLVSVLGERKFREVLSYLDRKEIYEEDIRFLREVFEELKEKEAGLTNKIGRFNYFFATTHLGFGGLLGVMSIFSHAYLPSALILLASGAASLLMGKLMGKMPFKTVLDMAQKKSFRVLSSLYFLSFTALTYIISPSKNPAEVFLGTGFLGSSTMFMGNIIMGALSMHPNFAVISYMSLIRILEEKHGKAILMPNNKISEKEGEEGKR